MRFLTQICAENVTNLHSSNKNVLGMEISMKRSSKALKDTAGAIHNLRTSEMSTNAARAAGELWTKRKLR